MTEVIPLISGVDGFEYVRNQIAVIIAGEQALQQALATAGGQDPTLWKLRTYIERSNPWEMFRDGASDASPVVNVWYDSSTTELGSSNLATRQQMTSVINVDCIGYATAEASGSGHTAGDEAAAKVAQRGARLVRGILMHGKYRYLGSPSIIARRHLQNRSMFQPTDDTGRPVQRVVGVRLAFAVDHLETVSVTEYDSIEGIDIEMRHDPDGMVIAEMKIDFDVPD